MDLNMALSSNLSLDDILVPGGSTGYSDQGGSGGDMAPEPQGHRLGPQTQMWSLAAVRSGCHHCPRWQCWPLRLARPQQQHDPQTLTWILDIHVAFEGNRNLKHQHRPWL